MARCRTAIALLAVAVVLSRCSPLAGRTGGDIVRFGSTVEPETLNPLLGATVAVANVAALAFDGLVRIDAKGQPVPDLAIIVPSRANGGISADGTTVTYHLDPRAHWHDGAPVTADDVIFTWRAIMNPRNNVAVRQGYDQITRIDALDAHTVRVRLRRIYASVLYLFTPSIVGAILPKHLLAVHPDLNQVPFNAAPVGSGPYRVREWRHADRIVFEANRAYFLGAPAITRIEMRFIPDANTLLNLVRAHEIDVTGDITVNQLQELRKMPGVTTTLVPTNSFIFLSFNTRRAPLNDVRVRRALCYAIDPKRIFDIVYHGVGLQAPTDQNPASGWADPSVHYYPTDPTHASVLLDKAGWRLRRDGFRYRAGERFTLIVAARTGSKTSEQVELITQAAWRNVGIDARIKNAPGNLLFAQPGGILNQGQFDVAIAGFAQDPDPDHSWIVGPGTVPPHGINETGYVGDSEFAQLQREATSTYDLGRRHALYNRIQRILIRDVPRYTLLWSSDIQVKKDSLHGVAMNPSSDMFWNVRDWTLSRT